MSPRRPSRWTRLLERAARAAPGPAAAVAPVLGPRYATRVAELRIRALLEAGDFDAAEAQVEALSRAAPDAVAPLELRGELAARRGDLRGQALALHRAHLVQPGGTAMDRERVVLGRLVVTSPGWLPWIAGTPSAVEPAVPAVVLHLLGSPGPGASGEAGARLRERVREGRDAGFEALVAGRGRSGRGAPSEPPPWLAGIPDLRWTDLAPGPPYPGDRPADERLLDEAWLAARMGHRARPAIVHAWCDRPGDGIGLVGLALRGHLRRPLVCEVGWEPAALDAPDAPDGGGEARERVARTAARVLRAADHVIAPSEAARGRIVGLGVDPAYVTVLGRGDGVAALGDVYRAVLDRWSATVGGGR